MFAENISKTFSACFNRLGNRLKTGFLDGGYFPQCLTVCIDSQAALLGGGQLREGFPNEGRLFCRIILHGILIASTVLLALVVDGIVGVAMVTMALVLACSAFRLSMMTAPISSETSTSVVVPSKNAYLIFIMCPFRLRALGGRDTKRAGGHDGRTGCKHLYEGMTKHGGYIEFKKSLSGIRHSMYPAASNAHLKALRFIFI